MADPSRPAGADLPGEGVRRRLTLQDIADAAGVSPGLVSMVLRGRPGPSATTAAKVAEVAERLGYRPNRTASQLASRRTQLIGVTSTPGNPYHGELVEEILSRTHDRGYEVLLSPVTRTHEEFGAIQTLVDSRCEVIILLNTTLEPADLEKALDGLPAVVVGPTVDLSSVDVVRTDDTTAMTKVVNHLVGLGHTRIAHVDGGEAYLPQVRRAAYEAAMARHGLAPFVVPGGETQDHGADAADELLAGGDFTAVTAYNDMCAIGVLDRLQKRGVRVPEDVSVTGFDDDRIADLHGLSLTTINPLKLEQARRAVDCAIERVDGGRTERAVHEFTPSLVVRRTTAPAPARTSRRITAARRSAQA